MIILHVPANGSLLPQAGLSCCVILAQFAQLFSTEFVGCFLDSDVQDTLIDNIVSPGLGSPKTIFKIVLFPRYFFKILLFAGSVLYHWIYS